MKDARPVTKRACNKLNEKGEPCGTPPLKGKDYCIGHASREEKESVGFGGAQEGSGRPRRPRVIDVILASITERAKEIDAGLWEATKAERGVVVGNGPTAHVEMVPDWPTRIAAYRELMDRGHGRPKQSSELTIITQDHLDHAIEQLEAELAGNDPDRRDAGVDSALQAAED